MKPQAGMLDRQITILKRTTHADNKGGLSEDFTPHATIRAHYTPMQARDTMSGGVIDNVHYVGFLVRYRTDIKTSDRILFDGNLYDIQSVQEAEYGNRRMWTQIYARAI